MNNELFYIVLTAICFIGIIARLACFIMGVI